MRITRERWTDIGALIYLIAIMLWVILSSCSLWEPKVKQPLNNGKVFTYEVTYQNGDTEVVTASFDCHLDNNSLPGCMICNYFNIRCGVRKIILIPSKPNAIAMIQHHQYDIFYISGGRELTSFTHKAILSERGSLINSETGEVYRDSVVTYKKHVCTAKCGIINLPP